MSLLRVQLLNLIIPVQRAVEVVEETMSGILVMKIVEELVEAVEEVVELLLSMLEF
jgi:hypothetical protein